MTTETSRTMLFEGPGLAHLRLALIGELQSAAEPISEPREHDSLADALPRFDRVRAVLDLTGLDSSGPSSANVDLEEYGELILDALLGYARAQRDFMSDELQQLNRGLDEVAVDESELVTLTGAYFASKEAIAELKARGIGVGEAVVA
jgi:hypothetical protein